MSLRGYEFFSDESTGELLVLHKATGNIQPADHYVVPPGSRILTPDDQARYYAKKEKETAEAETHFYKKGRKFFFAARDKDFHDIDAATMARLVYLGTFLGFDGTLKCYHTANPITRRDLPDILQLTKGPASQFWTAVKGTYIHEEENGQLSLSPDFFRRGTIRNDGGRSYQQFFIDAVRELYLKTPSRQHRHLGYIFQMLPYISIEYNVLCHNPEEEDMTKIQFMTVEEFCAAIGYSSNQQSRLMDLYAGITFPTGSEGEQVFCSFVSGNRKQPDHLRKIVVNPYVLYKGKHWREVQILGEFCKH